MTEDNRTYDIIHREIVHLPKSSRRPGDPDTYWKVSVSRVFGEGCVKPDVWRDGCGGWYAGDLETNRKLGWAGTRDGAAIEAGKKLHKEADERKAEREAQLAAARANPDRRWEREKRMIETHGDLLESSKALLTFLDAYPHQWGVDIAGPQAALRAAIAKAEGRS